MKALKIVVAAIALFASAVATAGPKFGNWEVDFENDRIVNTIHETEYVSSVTIVKPGHFAAFIYPREMYGSGFKPADIVNKSNLIMNVNGVNVKVTAEMNHNGVMRLIAETERGNDHIVNEFWSKRRITFKVNGNVFWVSGQGVQKAWNVLGNSRAI